MAASSILHQLTSIKEALFSRLNILWALGFVILFGINIVVESVIFTLLNLHYTPKNDGYFIAWWGAVLFWLLFGRMIINYFVGKKSVSEVNNMI